MDKIKVFTKNASKLISKNSPSILTAMGVAGLIGTSVLAVKATPKAILLLEEKHNEELTALDVTKLCWKEYIPTVVLGSVSIACIVGANSVNIKRNATLASLYTIANSNLSDYENKVKQLLGEKKHKKIKEEIVGDKIKVNPVDSNQVIFAGKDGVLCYDVISGRYFRQDQETIRKAENKLNRELLSEMYQTLNDFYYEIGLPNIKIGEEIGWHADMGEINVEFSSHLSENNEPCLAIDFDTQPIMPYWE